MKIIIRHKIITVILAALVLLLCFLTACVNTKDDALNHADKDFTRETAGVSAGGNSVESIQTLAEQYKGKKVGVLLGTYFDVLVGNCIPDASVEYFNATTDEAEALTAGKISAYVADEPVARLIFQSYDDQYICGVLEKTSYGFIFPKNSEKTEIIRPQFNEFIKKIRSDGTIKELEDIWLGADESKKVVDMSDLSGENGILELAITTANGPPFVYIKDNRYVGYDVDMAVRFCREYGYGINITDSNPGGFFTVVAMGRADFGASSVCITEERKQELDFSDPNYEGGVVLVTKGNTKAKAFTLSDFFNSVSESFKKTFIRENRWVIFVSGLIVTLLIAVISSVAGSVLGFGAFLLYRKEKKVPNRILDVLSAFLQMTPVVVILMIFYYLVFAESRLDGIVVSIIAFSLMYTCAVLGLLKTSVKAVDRGQTEAVMALGYEDTRGFLRMILPQAMPHFIPGYKSEVINLIKSTSIVGYITVQDLTMVTDIIRARTYEAFFPLLVSALVYFVMAFLLTKLIERISIKVDPHSRTEGQILKGVKRDD